MKRKWTVWIAVLVAVLLIVGAYFAGTKTAQKQNDGEWNLSFMRDYKAYMNQISASGRTYQPEGNSTYGIWLPDNFPDAYFDHLVINAGGERADDGTTVNLLEGIKPESGKWFFIENLNDYSYATITFRLVSDDGVVIMERVEDLLRYTDPVPNT